MSILNIILHVGTHVRIMNGISEAAQTPCKWQTYRENFTNYRSIIYVVLRKRSGNSPWTGLSNLATKVQTIIVIMITLLVTK